ncbi:HNH endonuclease [Burkholderia ambifaria]|uniref:HNH endonuclease n=1 Tax=Burkholderia ambifaria TaxID=152480 RepID=UPI00158AC307|nr:HNH endonuclease signature motif containing protein [Burkholderia ambifaria]
MPDLLTYTGEPLNEFATSVIDALEAEGFVVKTTEQGPRPDQRKTLHITWRGVVIGSMNAHLWGRKGYACGYRFPMAGSRPLRNKIPEGFDMVTFAKQHGCDPDRLYLYTDGSGSYLWVEDNATTLLLMRHWARLIDEDFFPSTGSGDAVQIQNDVIAILADTSKSETERLAEVAVRLGQGQFRSDLDAEFGGACAATGLSVRPALRASHILPWRNSSATQRRDPKNGLLLSANLDALFDCYMITFRPNGKLECSAVLNRLDRERLGPMPDLAIMLCDERAAYLQLHNAEFERLEKRRAEYVRASAR